MASSDAEKRAYARGYAAGQKRTAAQDDRWKQIHADMHAKRNDRRDRFFSAALTGLMAQGGWSMDGQPLKEMADYVELARRFAYKALEKLPGE